ncbi:MAG: HD domain-containing protein [Vallitaleaceae bacterium]|jgi:putative two-component system response regulator|nr:HD domain-containing protein [Vallitaleaceae bacterium]
MKILIVDDEVSVLNALKRQINLLDLALDIDIEADSRIAKDRMLENKYDILLTDQMMPYIEGLELIRYTREVSEYTVNILMTGYSDFNVLISAINEGRVYQYLPKPWTEAELGAVLEKTINYKCEIDEDAYILSQYLTDKKNWINMSKTLQSEISDQKDNLATAFMRIIQVKDYALYQHATNVSALAEGFGRFLLLSEKQIDLLKFAGLLHDLGKIVIHDRIVFKKERLDEKEYEHMKRHPLIGAQVLQEIPSLAYLAEVVEQHHERVDGNGYLSGLVGENIRYEAQIIGLVDAFDALVSQRIYKLGMPTEVALEIISSGKAGLFDEVLVEKFHEYVAYMNGGIRKRLRIE